MPASRLLFRDASGEVDFRQTSPNGHVEISGKVKVTKIDACLIWTCCCSSSQVEYCFTRPEGLVEASYTRL